MCVDNVKLIPTVMGTLLLVQVVPVLNNLQLEQQNVHQVPANIHITHITVNCDPGNKVQNHGCSRCINNTYSNSGTATTCYPCPYDQSSSGLVDMVIFLIH